MSVKNNTILERVFVQGSNDYQQRVPDPTTHTVAEVSAFLFDPMNRRYWNEFSSNLVQRIGTTIAHNKRWDNPLAPFKREKMAYGSTIQEIAPAWLKAHTYDDAAETLLKMERPEFQAAYHSIDRFDRYDLSITDVELRQAFVDDFGLNKVVDSAMSAQMNSDAYDEYRIMNQLIATHHENWGIFGHQISAAPTDEATCKELLKAVRTYAGKFQFPSVLYNAQKVVDIPVFAKQDELVFMTTPEVMASIDVDALASVFNLSKAELNTRTVIVDEFPIPNCYGILTTKDFFVCADTLMETTSFWNAETLTNKYYLHHQGVYSVSPFVPCVMFTTDAGTAVSTAVVAPASLALTAEAETAAPGAVVQLTATLSGSITGATVEEIAVKPDSCLFTVAAVDTDESPLALNSRTYVDRFGRLHIQKTGIEAGDTITVTAVSTYVNPSGQTTAYTASVEVEVA